MKILDCPLNGPRNIQEFVYGGEVVVQPPSEAAPEEWADWIFMHDNTAGVIREWWMHSASAYWFIAERDTTRDEILRTYPASELFRGPMDPSQPSRTLEGVEKE